MQVQSRIGYSFDAPVVDWSLIAGISACLMLVAGSALVSGLGSEILHLGSFLLVVGGTAAATLVNYSFADFRYAGTALLRVIFGESTSTYERIAYLVDLAQRSRRDGILSVEREAARVGDRFLQLSLQLAVDGTPSPEIKRVLETEMRAAFDRHRRAVGVFQVAGNLAPALGLIGTLLGLISMLGSLQNPDAIGPSMSLALVTTLYGALLANVIFIPVAGKLRIRGDEESLLKAITIEGIMGISRQENPSLIEQRLQSFLPAIGARRGAIE